jgi:transcriptional regulator with XRE-family HTH domain
MPRGGPRLRNADRRMNVAGIRVKECRLKQGWSQDVLCARIALATEGEWNPEWRDIVRLETGIRTITDLELLALAQALGCKTTWLLQLNGESEGPK